MRRRGTDPAERHRGRGPGVQILLLPEGGQHTATGSEQGDDQDGNSDRRPDRVPVPPGPAPPVQEGRAQLPEPDACNSSNCRSACGTGGVGVGSGTGRP